VARIDWPGTHTAAIEFWWFGLKEARACVFAGSFFALLLLSRVVPLGAVPRYDAILIGALLLQAAMLWTRLETRDELAAICLFHLFGFALEVFKTNPAIGSWSYPEPGYSKLLGVPLYSGFMYAAVASYMIQAWRLFDLEVTGMPPARVAVPLALLIYVNFFTHHWLGDCRWWLAAALMFAYRRTWVRFTPHRVRCAMPLVLSIALIGFFVWIAENIATSLRAWTYPNQVHGWNPVHHGKISSWMLLVVITFTVVAALKRRKAEAGTRPATAAPVISAAGASDKPY